MPDIVQRVIREPGAEGPDQFTTRVRRLALVYFALFFGSIVGFALVVWKVRLFVTLSQRSNVETLTIAFFLVFFLYLAVLSARGALGALRIAGFWVRRRLGTPALELERHKQAAMGRPHADAPVVALSALLERSDRPGEPFEVPVRDEAGDLGSIQIDGARVSHRQTKNDGSSELLAFFVRQVEERLQQRGGLRELRIVEWQRIDDESTSQYLAQVEFARALAKKLGGEPLWPRAQVTPEDVDALARTLRALCPVLRSEAFLPAWEFSAEHKLPIIPEPLGIISLNRAEKRVDQLASMGCATLVVLFAVLLIAFMIAFPPWVPGS